MLGFDACLATGRGAVGAVGQAGRTHMSKRDERDDSFDDLDEFLAEAMEDPTFAAAHQDAAERSRLLRQLVEHRRSHWSQTAVAKAMGTTQSAVSDLEGGATDPRLSTLQRYARAIGCRLYLDVITDTGWQLHSTPRSFKFTFTVRGDVRPSFEDAALMWHVPDSVMSARTRAPELPETMARESADNYALSA